MSEHNPSFLHEIEIRDVDIQGQSQWYWPKGDTGAFGDATDGPMRDWIEGHSTKYFKYLDNNSLVVTAGACCGMHTRFYANKFERVYAFEPDARSFHCMVNNTPFRNVVKFNAGLGATCGTYKLDITNTDNIGIHKIVPPNLMGENYHPIQMLTIDSLNLPACSLIQLDVELYEKQVLLGAEETIDKYKPVIVVEHFSDHEFMDRLGYKKVDQSFSDSIYVRKNAPWN